jgi:DNA-3-methyladenine glycosylase II
MPTSIPLLHHRQFESEQDCNLALRALAQRDAGLQRVLHQCGTPPFWQRAPGFAALAHIILEQQVSLASAQAVQARVKQAAGGMEALALLKLGAKGLGEAGVTRPKQNALLALAQACESNALDLNALAWLEDDAAHDALTAIKGIGPWTANVYLIIALCRKDVWPLHDVALHEAMKQVDGLEVRPDSAQAAMRAQQWQPYRSAVARLLWHVRLHMTGRSFTTL